jgi:hypothetical protein
VAQSSPALAWFVGEQAQELGWHADQLSFARKAHIKHIRTPANDLAVLVQPGEQRSVLGVLGDLLDPTKQRDTGALVIAPALLSRSGCLSGHDAPAFPG